MGHIASSLGGLGDSRTPADLLRSVPGSINVSGLVEGQGPKVD